ncbi:hypothetical protein D3C87_1198580 [compost metagenome]
MPVKIQAISRAVLWIVPKRTPFTSFCSSCRLSPAAQSATNIAPFAAAPSALQFSTNRFAASRCAYELEIAPSLPMRQFMPLEAFPPISENSGLANAAWARIKSRSVSRPAASCPSSRATRSWPLFARPSKKNNAVSGFSPDCATAVPNVVTTICGPV